MTPTASPAAADPTPVPVATAASVAPAAPAASPAPAAGPQIVDNSAAAYLNTVFSGSQEPVPQGANPAAQPPAVPAEPTSPSAPAAEPPKGLDYAQLASQHSLDPNNAVHRQLLDQLYASSVAAQPGTVSQAPNIDLAAFEDVLLAGIQQPAAPPAAPQPPAAQPPNAAAPNPANPQASVQTQGNPSQYDDGFTWKDETEAYSTLAEAWDKADIPTYQKASQALFARNYFSMSGPIVQPLIEKIKALEQTINEIAPDFRQNKSQARLLQNQEAAYRSIRYDSAGAPRQGFEDFEELFVAPKDNATVKGPDGNAVPATPLNRIVAENPWIANIRVEDPNQDVAARKTFLQMYTAVLRLYRASKQPPVTPAAARTAFEAGRTAAQTNNSTDTARQLINTPGAPQPPQPLASYAQEVIAATGGNVSDIFGR